MAPPGASQFPLARHKVEAVALDVLLRQSRPMDVLRDRTVEYLGPDRMIDLRPDSHA